MGEHDHTDIFDRGLLFDLSTLIQRRRLLGLFAGAGLAATVGRAPGTDPTPTSSTPQAGETNAASQSAAANTTREIPEETAGPFPGDGSNGPNVLTRSGIVRQDIRSSFGTSSTVAGGVRLAIELTVLDLADGSKPLAGGAVYLWHCDREGRYSMYSSGVTNETFLRGVQEVDASGRASFTSIFPGCYAGRWPHIHFEVYRSLASATSAGNKIATSQIALPQAACEAVYATDGYSASVRNLSAVPLDRDTVFRDGYTDELGTVTGTVGSGLTVALSVPVR
jgi:protocatechuate 3,4-dioxygenase beta subunit